MMNHWNHYPQISHYTCTTATMYLISAVINLNNLILISLFRLNFRNNSKQDLDKPNVKKIKEKQCFEFYLLSFAPLYRIFFVVFSLLALGTSGYFYCCCILYVFLNWPTLDLILTALRRSGMFIFNIFTFLIKRHFFNFSYSINLCGNTWTGCSISLCCLLICFSTQLLWS